jgi:hypothetical protein
MSRIEHAYRRFAIERFPLPSEEQIAAIERRLGVELPDDYREFILKYNGGYFSEPEIRPVVEGCPQDALTCLWGIGASHEEAELGTTASLVLFDDNDPPQILPIGHTALGGLIILVTGMDDDRGTIGLKKAYGGSYHLADGIEELFGLLREPEVEDDN